MGDVTRLALLLPVLLTVLLLDPRPALGGGPLETLDLTGFEPGPVPGTTVAEVVPLRWDDRCLPPPHRMNDHLDPVPNPLGGDFLAVADAAEAFRRAMDRWTSVPTAYGALELAGFVTHDGERGLDFIHEITFRSGDDFDAIASSPSVALNVDATLAPGDDLDGDGDADVAASLSHCADADGDGDVELPPGFYRAGTIVDNDIVLNTREDGGYRFTVDDAAVDDHPRSVDLEAVAVHELGHSLGLAHVLDNQVSGEDGTAVTMYPFTDTGDPAAERAQRTLAADDVAALSLHYPEGSAAHGPAAVQPGDVAFGRVYGLIEGEVEDGETGLPVAGASLAARAWHGGDENESLPSLAASAWSGRTRLLLDADGQAVLLDPAYHLLDGRFRLAVPKGLYRLSVEPADGTPVTAGRIHLTALLGEIFGQQDFDEEAWNGSRRGHFERRDELRPGQARPVPVAAGRVTGGHHLVTGRWRREAPYGSFDARGFNAVPGGFLYAVAFPAAEVVARLAAGELPVAATFRTLVDDTSAPVRFARAALVAGRIEEAAAADGGPRAVLDLDRPLRQARPFVAQDGDFAPFHLGQPLELSLRILRAFGGGATHLFLVLETPPEPFPGPSGRPPLIGLDGPAAGNDGPILGRSWFAFEGEVFRPDERYNYMFALAFVPLSAQ